MRTNAASVPSLPFMLTVLAKSAVVKSVRICTFNMHQKGKQNELCFLVNNYVMDYTARLLILQ